MTWSTPERREGSLIAVERGAAWSSYPPVEPGVRRRFGGAERRKDLVPRMRNGCASRIFSTSKQGGGRPAHPRGRGGGVKPRGLPTRSRAGSKKCREKFC